MFTYNIKAYLESKSTFEISSTEKRVSIFDGELHNNSNSTKDIDIPMLGHVMAVHLSQDCKCLEPRVDCFVLSLHPLLKSISLRRTAHHCLRDLAPEWALSFVPIICLNSFKIIQKRHQGVTENCYIIVLATRIWAINPL
jgi:hypothetical protein